MKKLEKVVSRRRVGKPLDPRKYIGCWTERDLLGKEIVDALVIILRTRGCRWAWESGCSMCGYVSDCSPNVKEEDILFQFDTALQKFMKQKIAKIFTSGNFFDPMEVTPGARERILEESGRRFEKVIVETRPEFVKEELIEEGLRYCKEFEVAIGLETANDSVLDKSINKGFHFADFVNAAKIVKDSGAFLKTYLLIKPPFLTEKEGIEDAVESARKVDEYTDTISFNPVNVQRHTLVELLWKRGEYRPPWLWSIAEVLARCRKLNARIICSLTAVGRGRGPHNCGKCDWTFLKAIEDYSLNLREDFEDIICKCKEEWLDYIEIQNLMQTTVDINSFLK